MIQITIKLNGTRPLIQHNNRLSNPLDPHTRRLKELTGQKKKTDELIAMIAAAEQRGSYYETSDGLVGMPTQNLHAALKVAAKTLKLGKQLEKALRFGGQDIPPIQVSGKTLTPEAHMKREDALLYVSVRNQSNRIMRARPIFQEWSSDHQFELDEKLLNIGELKQVAEIAGKDVGLCDWRPRFGTFEAEISNGKK